MKRTFQNLAIYLTLIIITIICLFPLLLMTRISFLPANKYFEMPVDWFAHSIFDHYSELASGQFLRYIGNSFIISFSTTIVVVSIGSLAAFGIARYRFRKKDNLLFFILGTRMGPAVVFAVPIYLMMVSLSKIDSFIGMILIYTFANLAFCIWMMYSFFSDISPEFEEAGMLDGLSEFGVFFRVALPMASIGLIATAIMVFTFIWNEFFYSLVLTRFNAKTFPSHIPSFFGAYSINWGGMFAASLLGTTIPIIFGISVRKYLARGLSMGAIK